MTLYKLTGISYAAIQFGHLYKQNVLKELEHKTLGKFENINCFNFYSSCNLRCWMRNGDMQLNSWLIG